MCVKFSETLPSTYSSSLGLDTLFPSNLQSIFCVCQNLPRHLLPSTYSSSLVFDAMFSPNLQYVVCVKKHLLTSMSSSSTVIDALFSLYSSICLVCVKYSKNIVYHPLTEAPLYLMHCFPFSLECVLFVSISPNTFATIHILKVPST